MDLICCKFSRRGTGGVWNSIRESFGYSRPTPLEFDNDQDVHSTALVKSNSKADVYGSASKEINKNESDALLGNHDYYGSNRKDNIDDDDDESPIKKK